MKNDENQRDAKKPVPFIAPLSDTPVTPEEAERRERKMRRLKMIGVNPLKIDSEDGESENPYRAQAMVYIQRDEEVPAELLEKIFSKKY